MESQRFKYHEAEIHYLRFGNGPSLAICFHGYGELANSFAFFEKYAGHQYTFISIDLPFHGKTIWPQKKDFVLKELLEIINFILSENKFNVHRYSLIGFSLGGRVALSLYQAIPEKIEKIILLAPDGLKVNFWYWLSTQTWIGNQLFSFTMKHPGWFFGFLKMMNVFRLVNASIYKFVNHYIGNKDVRVLLYQRWTSLRKLKPGIIKIKSLIGKHHTKVNLVYGKYDRIILTSGGMKFRKGIEDHVSVFEIHCGHQVLHEKCVKEILPLLISDKDNP